MVPKQCTASIIPAWSVLKNHSGLNIASFFLIKQHWDFKSVIYFPHHCWPIFQSCLTSSLNHVSVNRSNKQENCMTRGVTSHHDTTVSEHKLYVVFEKHFLFSIFTDVHIFPPVAWFSASDKSNFWPKQHKADFGVQWYCVTQKYYFCF